MKPTANPILCEETTNPFEIQNDLKKLRANLDEIDSRSIRLKFKNAEDPINLAFESIENTSVKTLAKDFIKEGFTDMISFITKICK